MEELETCQVSDIGEVCKRSGDLLTRKVHMIMRLNKAHRLLSERAENLTRQLVSVQVCVYDAKKCA